MNTECEYKDMNGYCKLEATPCWLVYGCSVKQGPDSLSNIIVTSLIKESLREVKK